MTKLLTVIDPRDRLSKARRSELLRYATANGVSFDESMPADLMRAQLRTKGLVRPDIAARVLGAPKEGLGKGVEQAQGANEVNATEDLMRQYQAQNGQKPAGKPVADMSINELRAEAKRLDIKVERRDNMLSLREKIEAKGG